MPDRFADGDPATPGPIDPSDPHAWHGGDLAGITAHLDHLQALGVRTLWLTPIFEARDEKIDQWGAFHGYWVTGSGALNPRMGTEAALGSLAEALHARGMRLVLDVVWNHTDYAAPVLAEHPDWFHPTGDIEDWNDPVERVQGRVHGLPDLAQERAEVADWLIAQTADRVRRSGVDGLRVDAVGHMPLDFLQTANRSLDAVVEGGGLWTLGEDFTGDPARLARTLREGGFDAVFDFPLHYALTDVACRDAPLARLGGTLSLDRLYGPDPGRHLVTFLDNHDLPRITSACGEDPARVDRALAMLFSLRGTPALTWGTEALLAGAEEPANRASMPWQDVDRRTTEITQLQTLRRDHPALHGGLTRLLHWEPGLLVLGRWTASEAAVIRIHTGTDFTLWSPPSALTEDARIVARMRATDRIAVESDQNDPVAATYAVRGTGVWVDILAPVEGRPAPWTDWTAQGPPVELEVVVPDAPASGTLHLVGAGPELGHWSPDQGVPVVDGRARLTLPAHTLATLKPVWRGPEGWVWAEGPDRVILVDPDRADTPQTMRWSPESAPAPSP